MASLQTFVFDLQNIAAKPARATSTPSIVGEPGLGKSRLIEEFRARLRDTPHTWTE
jgi:putative protein kinase ArgK-like GTPase of G3E family